MILSFGDQATEDLFHGEETRDARKIPNNIWDVVRRKLDMVNAAQVLADLKVPPNNRLETLRGHLKGFHSIRINQQYRVVFRWSEGNAKEVKVTDYH
jgi:proteic killer suppression protein